MCTDCGLSCIVFNSAKLLIILVCCFLLRLSWRSSAFIMVLWFDCFTTNLGLHVPLAPPSSHSYHHSNLLLLVDIKASEVYPHLFFDGAVQVSSEKFSPFHSVLNSISFYLFFCMLGIISAGFPFLLYFWILTLSQSYLRCTFSLSSHASVLNNRPRLTLTPPIMAPLGNLVFLYVKPFLCVSIDLFSLRRSDLVVFRFRWFVVSFFRVVSI